MIGKAKFKDVEKFYLWAFDNWTNWGKSIFNKHESEHRNWKKYDLFYKLFFDKFHYDNDEFIDRNNKELINNFKEIYDYLNMLSLSFELNFYSEEDNYAIICYGKTKIFVVPLEYLDITLFKDYNDVPVDALNQIGTGEGLIPTTSIESMSINSTKSAIDKANEQMNKLKKDMEDVSWCKSGALAEMKVEIEKLEQKLREEKNRQMEILNKKQEEMKLQMEKLENQIFLLDTQIYGIRCFMGECIEFTKLRSGKNTSIEEPVILYQKIRYMDEELGKYASIYNADWNEKDTFESWLKNSPNALDVFAPNDKCITLIRVSREKRYRVNDRFEQLTYICEKYQGGRIGIIVRNGENVYLGWTDEDRINVNENVFYNTELKVDAADEDATVVSDKKEDIASRYFVFAILQGIIKDGNILKLPPNENIMKPSKYIIYSVADAWLIDNTWGSFADIIKKVNKQFTVGDNILILGNLHDDKHWNSYNGRFDDCNRCHGDSNRTQEMNIKSGDIYPINLIEDNQAYIQGKKEVYNRGRYNWGTHDATANFKVFSDEFMNLTYMNSVWIDYAIRNGNTSDWIVNGEKARYASVVRFLKIAKEYLLEREQKEAKIIKKFYPNISSLKNWQVTLSEWKIEKRVREINEFQAKRFTKYIEK